MSGGTVNISRDLWEDTAFPADEPFSRREAWIWLIAEASWKDRERNVGGKVIALPRGSLLAPSRFLAKAWTWSEPKVRRFLADLEERKMVTRVTDAGLTVVTLCNYERYQAAERVSDAPATQPRRARDANEKKGERRGKEEEANASSDAAAADPLAFAFMAYNAAAERQHWRKATKLTASRRKALSARFGDSGGPEGWLAVLAAAEGSAFLTGRDGSAQGPPGWFDFDWLVNPNNFIKLMEGKYDPRPSRPLGSSQHPGPAGLSLVNGHGRPASIASIAAGRAAQRAAGG